MAFRFDWHPINFFLHFLMLLLLKASVKTHFIICALISTSLFFGMYIEIVCRVIVQFTRCTDQNKTKLCVVIWRANNWQVHKKKVERALDILMKATWQHLYCLGDKALHVGDLFYVGWTQHQNVLLFLILTFFSIQSGSGVLLCIFLLKELKIRYCLRTATLIKF